MGQSRPGTPGPGELVKAAAGPIPPPRLRQHLLAEQGMERSTAACAMPGHCTRTIKHRDAEPFAVAGDPGRLRAVGAAGHLTGGWAGSRIAP